MAALWSRIGQSHACGCRTCLTSANGLFRRSGVAAIRRKPTFADIFTAAYTGIFATVAVWDAKKKDVRRDDLEKQLQEAKANLSAIRQEADRLAASRDNIDEFYAQDATNQFHGAECPKNQFYSAILDVLDNPYTSAFVNPDMVEDPNMPLNRISTLKIKDSPLLSRPELKSRSRVNYKMLEELVWHENTTDSQGDMARHAMCNSQLEAMERALARCVLWMLSTACDVNLWTAYHSEPAPDKLPAVLRDTWSVLAEGYPRFESNARYSPSIDRQMLEAAAAASTKDLESRRNLLVRICHNLLLLKGELSVYSFNTLLLVAGKLGFSETADTLIYFFYNHFMMSPSEATHICILNHYRATGSLTNFLGALDRFIGRHRVGSKVWNRRVNQVQQNERYQRHARGYNLTLAYNRAVAKVDFSPRLLASTLEGLLHFDLRGHAVNVFVSALAEGIDFTCQLLELIIDECVAALDWHACIRLLQGLATEAHKFCDKISNFSPESWYSLESRLENLFALAGLKPSFFYSDLEVMAPFLQSLNIDVLGFGQLCNTAANMGMERRLQSSSSNSRTDYCDMTLYPTNVDALLALNVYGLGRIVAEGHKIMLKLESDFIKSHKVTCSLVQRKEPGAHRQMLTTMLSRQLSESKELIVYRFRKGIRRSEKILLNYSIEYSKRLELARKTNLLCESVEHTTRLMHQIESQARQLEISLLRTRYNRLLLTFTSLLENTLGLEVKVLQATHQALGSIVGKEQSFRIWAEAQFNDSLHTLHQHQRQGEENKKQNGGDVMMLGYQYDTQSENPNKIGAPTCLEAVPKSWTSHTTALPIARGVE